MTGDNTTSTRRKRFLFVDDEPAFLDAIRELFSELSRGAWEIVTAENHAQGLAEIQRQRPDVVVLDIGMPVLDGIQFLRLLARAHPDLQVVMLTGNATAENRETCLENGAALFLQKPVAQGDYAQIFAALDALAGAQPQEGFKGVMQRVGLHEVLQFECLGRRSSILEIFTGKVRGRIYICDGTIVHAVCGNLQGEVALYSLLALRGGEFNLLQFTEPAQRTIEGSWEMLLMESARLSDEAAQPAERRSPAAAATSAVPEHLFPIPSAPPPDEKTPPAPGEPETTWQPASRPTISAPTLSASYASDASHPRITEVLLCSGAGEVLYDWECRSIERRMNLLRQIEEQAGQLSNLAPVGRFDRLEIYTAEDRLVCQIHPQRRLLVRRAVNGGASS